ncbi:LON peptidase substrate-binding domain-containing protein [Psychromonas sp.]|uniref:LON peptidase substrate-binding domain-containing protein n=1 Tax=Psychromonas sp. TaxID=1884585 RepID=UPI003561CD88
MKLALFPLSVFLLPGGITRLRIFEARYKRLVAEAMASGQGFGLCLPNGEKGLYAIATRVEIYDFGQDGNGLLTIDIKGVERFTFDNITSDSDGLLHADATMIKDWQAAEVSAEYQFMLPPLKMALTSHPLYSQQDNQQTFDNLSWVCRRWLELLPIPVDKKYWLANQSSLAPSIDFIREVINESNR